MVLLPVAVMGAVLAGGLPCTAMYLTPCEGLSSLTQAVWRVPPETFLDLSSTCVLTLEAAGDSVNNCLSVG